jgi:glycosyltransferase involved in cell wall biosynthesis
MRSIVADVVGGAVSSRKRAQAEKKLKEQIDNYWDFDSEKPSVVFLHHAYYYFKYLAAALRKRGVNAINVMRDPLDHDDRFHLHGCDIELFDEDPEIFRVNLDYMDAFVRKNASLLHFAGMGRQSFSDNMDGSFARDTVPWDFLDLKRSGVKFGYTHSGCCDLVSKTAFRRWSGGVCEFCHWRDEPAICSDLRNMAWGHTVTYLCDLICIETDPMLDFKSNPLKVYREPLTCALDPGVWHPDLAFPADLKIEKEQDEVLIFHAMANFSWRRQGDDNIKGSSAVFAAIEKLKKRGHKVRMIFHDQVPNIDLRHIQVQADIVVDQLRYGRYGAMARESLMLGKPTVGYVNPKEEIAGAESECVLEAPIVNATVDTVFDVLEELVLSAEKRKTIGEHSRAYALKWWSADACAERFEEVLYRLQSGLPPMESSVDATMWRGL